MTTSTDHTAAGIAKIRRVLVSIGIVALVVLLVISTTLAWVSLTQTGYGAVAGEGSGGAFGALEITNSVEPNGATHEDDYDFQYDVAFAIPAGIVLNDAITIHYKVEGIHGAKEFTATLGPTDGAADVDAKVTVTINGGEKATFENIPQGVTVKATQLGCPDGFTVTVDGKNGKASAEKTIGAALTTIDFVNVYTALNVTKQVESLDGQEINPGVLYTFKARLVNPDSADESDIYLTSWDVLIAEQAGSADVSTVPVRADRDGWLTFQMEASKRATLEGIPLGTECEVSEVFTSSDPYRPETASRTTTINHDNLIAELGFLNRYGSIPEATYGGIAVSKQVVDENGNETASLKPFSFNIALPSFTWEVEGKALEAVYLPIMSAALADFVGEDGSFDEAKLLDALQEWGALNVARPVYVGEEDPVDAGSDMLKLDVEDGVAKGTLKIDAGHLAGLWGILDGAQAEVSEVVDWNPTDLYAPDMSSASPLVTGGQVSLAAFTNVKNSHPSVETVEVKVTKAWNNASAAADIPLLRALAGASSVQPASVAVYPAMVHADEEMTRLDDEGVNLDAISAWTHVWELPKYDSDGAEVAYTVVEDVPTGWSASYAQNGNDVVITNTPVGDKPDDPVDPVDPTDPTDPTDPVDPTPPGTDDPGDSSINQGADNNESPNPVDRVIRRIRTLAQTNDPIFWFAVCLLGVSATSLTLALTVFRKKGRNEN